MRFEEKTPQTPHKTDIVRVIIAKKAEIGEIANLLHISFPPQISWELLKDTTTKGKHVFYVEKNQFLSIFQVFECIFWT